MEACCILCLHDEDTDDDIEVVLSKKSDEDERRKSLVNYLLFVLYNRISCGVTVCETVFFLGGT